MTGLSLPRAIQLKTPEDLAWGTPLRNLKFDWLPINKFSNFLVLIIKISRHHNEQDVFVVISNWIANNDFKTKLRYGETPKY